MCVESHIGFVTRKRVAGLIPVFSAPEIHQVAVVNSQLFITIVFLMLHQQCFNMAKKNKIVVGKKQCRRRIKESQQTSSEKPAVKEGQQ